VQHALLLSQVPLVLQFTHTGAAVLQEFEADNDENNAAISRMRNALAAEADSQQGQ
jgi:hypothetical protein